MDLNPNQDATKFFSLQVLILDKKSSYTLKFSVILNKLEIFVSNDNNLPLSYKYHSK